VPAEPRDTRRCGDSCTPDHPLLEEDARGDPTSRTLSMRLAVNPGLSASWPATKLSACITVKKVWPHLARQALSCPCAVPGIRESSHVMNGRLPHQPVRQDLRAEDCLYRRRPSVTGVRPPSCGSALCSGARRRSSHGPNRCLASSEVPDWATVQNSTGAGPLARENPSRLNLSLEKSVQYHVRALSPASSYSDWGTRQARRSCHARRKPRLRILQSVHLTAIAPCYDTRCLSAGLRKKREVTYGNHLAAQRGDHPTLSPCEGGGRCAA